MKKLEEASCTGWSSRAELCITLQSQLFFLLLLCRNTAECKMESAKVVVSV